MSALFAATGVAYGQAPAAGAPEDEARETEFPERRVRLTHPGSKSAFSFLSTELSAGALMQGSTGRAVKGFADYSELFGIGRGFELTAHIRMQTALRGEGALTLGPVLRIGHVSFDGGTAFDPSGSSLRADSLNVTRVMLGFHLTPRFGEFYFGPELVVGPTFIGGVDAVYTPAAGSATSGKIYDDTIDFGVEIRLRAGWAYELEQGSRIGVEFFMGYAALGRPQEYNQPDAALQGTGPGTINGGVFGFAVAFELRRLKAPRRELR